MHLLPLCLRTFSRRTSCRNGRFHTRSVFPFILPALLFLFFLPTPKNLASAAESLPALQATTENLTVSGLSSGAFMAVQMHVAHSTLVRGAGILAGGPYYCAQGSAVMAITACMSPNFFWSVPPVSRLVREAEQRAGAQQIDPLENLRRSRAWILSGARDDTVKTEVVDALYDFYANWLPASSVVYERIPDAGHAMINPDTQKARECPITASPYINHCGNFDAPGRLLAHLLGPLKDKAAEAKGTLLAFKQGEFVAAGGNQKIMDDTAYVYIPSDCRAGGCRIHVAFHGCKQQAEEIGELYVRDAGYNRWAESNRLIVLYPQTVKNNDNPNGCWDWWGYSGSDYHLRSGKQISAVKAMIDRLASSPR